jgi:calcineurin-like phosphoesterase family protein
MKLHHYIADTSPFATSDWHLGHDNVIAYSKRPFRDKEHMHEALVTNWNNTITDNDTVYLLGDLCWKIVYLKLYNELKGTIHLVAGNHDDSSEKVLKCDRWATVSHYVRIKVGEHKVIACHYPFECWDGMERGSFHIHGHTHNNTSHTVQTIPRRYDIGVDAQDMKPVRIQALIENSLMREYVDSMTRQVQT